MKAAANELTHNLSVALAAGGQRVAERIRAAAAELEKVGGELGALAEASLKRSADAVRLAMSGEISAEDCDIALERELDGLALVPATLLEKGGSEAIKTTKGALTHLRDVIVPALSKIALAAL